MGSRFANKFPESYSKLGLGRRNGGGFGEPGLQYWDDDNACTARRFDLNLWSGSLDRKPD